MRFEKPLDDRCSRDAAETRAKLFDAEQQGEAVNALSLLVKKFKFSSKTYNCVL